jgi:small subunit ribosomal protein S5
MVTKDKKDNFKKKPGGNAPATGGGEGGAPTKSVFSERKRFDNMRRRSSGKNEVKDEFDQKIVDIARVTRVMAGGKRMRFRACVAIGNKNGKVAVGIAKGADVTLAVNKAVNDAKKKIVDVPIVRTTIPHEIYQKTGAAKILLKPARLGNGVIAGGAIRIIIELTGIQNITSKNLGTNNKINVAKCTIEALRRLKKVETRKVEEKTDKVENDAQAKKE